jgi:hypothetical protein
MKNNLMGSGQKLKPIVVKDTRLVGKAPIDAAVDVGARLFKTQAAILGAPEGATLARPLLNQVPSLETVGIGHHLTCHKTLK